MKYLPIFVALNSLVILEIFSFFLFFFFLNLISTTKNGKMLLKIGGQLSMSWVKKLRAVWMSESEPVFLFCILCLFILLLLFASCFHFRHSLYPQRYSHLWLFVILCKYPKCVFLYIVFLLSPKGAVNVVRSMQQWEIIRQITTCS